jgi:1-acyl-sn-glycerol-3-phosphate acyltransferase
VIHGTIAIMPKGSWRIRSGRVDLHFLEPIPTTGFDYAHRTDLMTRTWTAMAETLRDVYGSRTSENPVANQG